MTSVAVVQHVPWEGPGLVRPALSEAGLDVRLVRLLDGEPVPEVESLAGLVVLGGPMRATDCARHPALALEIELLRAAVSAGLPVLGICLGHQLLGLALGGALVTGGAPEVGVAPVRLTADSALGPTGAETDVLHWHGDQVSLPPGAELLARSDRCANQAFRYGAALGVQFHVEVDRPMLREWLTHPQMRDDVPPGARVERDFRLAEGSLARTARALLHEFTQTALTRTDP